MHKHLHIEVSSCIEIMNAHIIVGAAKPNCCDVKIVFILMKYVILISNVVEWIEC